MRTSRSIGVADLAFTVTTAGPLRTTEQAAQFLGVKPQTLSVWRVTGRYDLPFIRVGRNIRYRQVDLDRWLASRTCGR
jgi:excisionase family DNA binding protein